MKVNIKKLLILHISSLTFFMIVVVFIIASAERFAPGDQDGPTNVRREIDDSRREWKLLDWEEGTRPYLKNLKEREAWYRKNWGEDWYGPQNKCRIHNPGNWKWEEVVTVPPEMASGIKVLIKDKKKVSKWGKRFNVMNFVWAPGGGAVTDIYVLSDFSFYHYDPLSKKSTFIGNPKVGGALDGVEEYARLQTARPTLSYITGRLYFVQKIGGKSTLRYVEKLLPYECTLSKKIVYLPAVLDWNELYRKVKSPYGGELVPVMREGKRSEPIFVVRTNPAVKIAYLPGTRRGRRPLISPDGKGIYLPSKGPRGRYWNRQTLYNKTFFFDIRTGKNLGKLKLLGDAPENFSISVKGLGTHGGNNVGYDGKIYTAQHGGCCGPCGSYPGRMFSIDPDTGKVTMLYDSVPEDNTRVKMKMPVIDGPADAKSLRFTSTYWQVQSPRTGAIINGGWDNSGIRRYHDGFVTTIVNADWRRGVPPRPGWNKKTSPIFYHSNSNPSVAPNGDFYIADKTYKEPRIIRIYRTDWPPEQPVNGYAEKFLPKERVEKFMLEYAQKYIDNFEENNRLISEYLKTPRHSQ